MSVFVDWLGFFVNPPQILFIFRYKCVGKKKWLRIKLEGGFGLSKQLTD